MRSNHLKLWKECQGEILKHLKSLMFVWYLHSTTLVLTYKWMFWLFQDHFQKDRKVVLIHSKLRLTWHLNGRHGHDIACYTGGDPLFSDLKSKPCLWVGGLIYYFNKTKGKKLSFLTAMVVLMPTSESNHWQHVSKIQYLLMWPFWIIS